jgi:hypothetical protein
MSSWTIICERHGDAHSYDRNIWCVPTPTVPSFKYAFPSKICTWLAPLHRHKTRGLSLESNCCFSFHSSLCSRLSFHTLRTCSGTFSMAYPTLNLLLFKPSFTTAFQKCRTSSHTFCSISGPFFHASAHIVPGCALLT